ncbi:MAG: efflux RND transporter periplasmic adaptor subunit [Syntrophales bacterium]|jgi:RND family efflux transporter MFP subunit
MTYISRLVSLPSVFLILVLIASCSSGTKPESKIDPVSVVIGNVHHGEYNQPIFVSGSVVSPDAPSTLTFLVPGKVVFVGPREGDYVKKGQKLAEVDPLDYHLTVAAAAAQLDQAKVGLRRAEEEYGRMKFLYDSKSLAPNDFEKFQASLDAAREQVRQATANDGLAKKRLSDATLVAPIDGYIDMRGIEPGETAAPGRPVFRIVRLNPIEVNVGVPETDLHLVRVGQKAVVTLPALPGQSFEGTLRIINVGADPGTRTYMARIVLPNPKHVLKVGMVAEVRIAGDRKISTTTVPGEAIVRDAQGATIVFVYYPEHQRVYSKRVKAGALYGNEVEIREGLSGNESIVLAGQDYLRDGVPVTIASRSAENASHSNRKTAP